MPWLAMGAAVMVSVLLLGWTTSRSPDRVVLVCWWCGRRFASEDGEPCCPTCREERRRG